MPYAEFSRICAILKNTHRVQILDSLQKKEQCVNELVRETGLAQPTISRHLECLLRAKLVLMRSQGRFHLFSINKETSSAFMELYNKRPKSKRLPFVAGEILYSWNIKTNELHWHGDLERLLVINTRNTPRTIAQWKERLHPDDRTRVTQAVEQHLSDRTPFSLTYRVLRGDGTYSHWADVGTIMTDDAGLPYKWVGMAREIPETGANRS